MDTTSRKKVVFIINNFLIGGVERLVCDLITHLDRGKFNLSIITVLGSGPWEPQFRELGVPLYFAGPTVPFSQSRSFKLMWLLMSPVVLLRTWGWLRREKPDTVITSLYQADIIGMWASYLAGVRQRILIQHDTTQFSGFRKLVKKHLAVKLATQIIAVSQSVNLFLLDYWNVSTDRVRVITNGIDIAKFSAGTKPTGNADDLVIGFIGRLEPVKGIDCLLSALAILQSKFNLSPRVIIAGSGSLQTSVAEYIRAHQLFQVELVGRVTEIGQMLAVLRDIDVVVLPSLMEGSPLAIMEWLAAHKLVIASDIPSLREIIIPDQNGILFEVNNATALAQVLAKVLTNRELVNQLQQGTTAWLQQFASQYDIKRTTEEYTELLNQPTSS
ncbi:MAG: glycosyltransferase family 4 protein [Patescibacteria group bacterium]|jgi:glycosyltransferase involved in cell wall biosynthesis